LDHSLNEVNVRLDSSAETDELTGRPVIDRCPRAESCGL